MIIARQLLSCGKTFIHNDKEIELWIALSGQESVCLNFHCEIALIWDGVFSIQICIYMNIHEVSTGIFSLKPFAFTFIKRTAHIWFVTFIMWIPWYEAMTPSQIFTICKQTEVFNLNWVTWVYSSFNGSFIIILMLRKVPWSLIEFIHKVSRFALDFLLTVTFLFQIKYYKSVFKVYQPPHNWNFRTLAVLIANLTGWIYVMPAHISAPNNLKNKTFSKRWPLPFKVPWSTWR